MGKLVKIKKIKPIVNYPSSVVQQNHGELLDGHGYVLWDIKSRTFEEVDIYNNYGYLTIDVEKGVIPQWVYDELDTKLPKFPRIRLRFKDTGHVDVKMVIGKIKEMFVSSEITVTRTDTIGKLKSGKNLNSNIVGDVHSVTFQNDLLQDFLQRKYEISDEDISAIIGLNHDVNTRLNQRKVAENIIWKPKKFTFDNMFSYGENNKINFDNLHGIIGLFAGNRMGKSSIFDALSFCMFDRSSRTKDAKHIINNQKEHFNCKFNFEIDGVDFFIERKAKWTRSGKNLKVDVDFWKEQDGIVTSLNGEQRRDTNKIIEEYLGTFDDFILSTLSLQGSNALFIDKSQSDRKDILSQFIGVDIFDKLHSIASDDNRDNSTIIRKFKKDDYPTQLIATESELVSVESDGDVNSVNLDITQTRLNELQDEKIELSSDLVPIENDNKNLSDLERVVNDLIQKKSEIEKSDKLIHEKTEQFEKLQILLETELDEFDEDDLKQKVKDYDKVVSVLNKSKHELEKLSIKFDSYTLQQLALDKHEYNPECDICVSNSQHIIQDKESLKGLFESHTKLVDDQNEYIRLCDAKMLPISNIKSEWKNFSELQSKFTRVENEITRNINKISSSEFEIHKIDNQLTNQNRLIGEYRKNETQIKKNQKLRDEIMIIDSDVQVQKLKLKDLDDSRLENHSKIGSLKSKIDSIKNNMDEVRKLEQETRRYTQYLSALNKDGISYELVEKSLPILEGEVNNILSQVVDFGMAFEIVGKNVNASLVYDEKNWPLELASGMEKFISGLAIRVALINISNLPAPNFLVIDEGLGTLDSDSLAQIHLLFQYLKTQFDFVIIISHLDVARDMVDDSITIKKVDKLSQIRFS